MGRMIRKQIYIEPRQEAVLRRMARQTGATEAELIRQAIDRQMGSLSLPGRDMRFWQDERAFIIRLIEKGPVPGGRSWEREELHER
jgi:hypothetical protein